MPLTLQGRGDGARAFGGSSPLAVLALLVISFRVAAD